jgi:MscS family membrane protein
VSQPGGPVWKFTANTVAVIPALYQEFGWGRLAQVLPASFFEIRFLRIRLWQWIGLVLLAAAAWLAAWLFRWILRYLGRRFENRPGIDRQLIQNMAGPLALLFGVAGFALALPSLGLTVPVHRVFVSVEKGIALGAFTWLVVRWLDVLAARIEQRFAAGRHSRAVGTVPFGRRTLKIFVAMMALIAALQNFGFNVWGLLAGLGIGGLAVALAAQKTVENLFGSVSLVADQPVRVGDVCRFGDVVGQVEDIGLRSTRLRTIDQTLVTIPNAQFSMLALENLSRRTRIPVRATVTLPQGTSAERVQAVLAGLCEMIVAQPKVDAASAAAQFVRMGANQLEIELFAYVQTAQWDEFVKIRQPIFLRALEVVGASGSTFR